MTVILDSTDDGVLVRPFTVETTLAGKARPPPGAPPYSETSTPAGDVLS